MPLVGRIICFGIVGTILAWPLIRATRELKRPARPAEPYVIDAAKIQPGAPPLRTGDPYWDHILGYKGDKP